MNNPISSSVSSRRSLLTSATALAAGLAGTALFKSSSARAAELVAEKSAISPAEPFRYCLNTSTIRGSNLPLAEVIDIASKAGFHGIEPWISEIEKSVQKGTSAADLRKRIDDGGLKVESAIGFAEWLVDDDDRRAKGLEHLKKDMDLVAQLGGKFIAAPPTGANDKKDGKPAPELVKIAERYRAICELGRKAGVMPMVELWGVSKTLSRLAEVAFVTVESGDPQATMLLDLYHLYKGGSDLNGLKMLNGARLPVIHTNDYPADPPRATISDSSRVYPGDGVAPLGDIFRTLRDIGFRGALSVELFNKDYWKQSPVKVAAAAIEKTRAAVKAAML